MPYSNVENKRSYDAIAVPRNSLENSLGISYFLTSNR